MGLFDRIRSWLGRSPRRDISRLESAEADAIDEVVNVSGGPLKKHHRRRALRDRRLLPKSRSMGRTLGVTKRKRLFSAEEAGRLFGATLRTRNRALRDLLTDPQQLERYGLPIWETEQDLAKALGISTKELWFYSIHRERERQPHYVTFALPKRSGGRRLIMAPKRRLKAIHRQLLRLLVDKLPVSDHAHGFRRDRNVRTGAQPHVGRRVVLRLDLKDFFPSVTCARVRGLLIAYGYGFPVATTLAVLMTEAERQPVEVDGQLYHVPIGPRHCVQGAPTSPGLCNTMLLSLDRRLAGLARKRGFQYTRYADDLSFSADADGEAVQRLRQVATKIIEEEGFSVNAAKTRVMRAGTRQTVTGVVVNQVLGLSRQDRRRLRAMAHRLSQQAAQGTVDAAKTHQWRGRLAYLSMLNPQQAARIPRP